MIKIARLLAAVFGLASVTFVHAQVTVIAYGGNSPTTGNSDYVTASQSFQRTTTNLAPGDFRTSFTDTAPLNPSSGYLGPRFYGGFEILTSNTTGTGNVGIIGGQRVVQSTPDSIQVVSAFTTVWPTSTTASLAGYLLFRQEDWRDTAGGASPLSSGGVTISSLTATYSIVTGNSSYTNGTTTRWIVQDASGQYYISQASTTPDLELVTTATQNVADTSWAAITPATSGSLNLDLGSLNYSVTGTAMMAASVTAAGLYFENDAFSGSGTASSQWLFQLNSLGLTATAAIPESATVSLLCAVGGLIFAAVRRYCRPVIC
ncbi:hypothetical protein OPIT5_27710 [Opitutaceae bacterium TAV5]|nr:hypothetical protein OPIT5_27710 [Opitutaceae bacterium TAV5]